MGELPGNKHVKYILSVENVGMKFLQFSSCSLVHLLPVTENDLVYLDLLFSMLEFTDLSFWAISCTQKKDGFVLVVMEHLTLTGAYFEH